MTQHKQHKFGGDWTEEKLERLNKYLIQYRNIFVQNKNARYYRTWYVDAFAGTGSRLSHESSESEQPLFEELYQDAQTTRYRDGSTRKSLELEKPFDFYLFIEQSKARIGQLQDEIRKDFPGLIRCCRFMPGDANKCLRDWCAERNWKKERAVVFLDPYGMQVRWSTIEVLAATKAIDLWYLFPVVTRLLRRDGNIQESWEKCLNDLFGTPDWRPHFYHVEPVSTLFGVEDLTERDASVRNIQKFIQERLRTCFAGVAEETLVLRNSKSASLYLLCFAAANKKGAPIALRIAKSILKD
jgi:three-Cys-motif partner protein